MNIQPNLKLYREDHLQISVEEVAEKLAFSSDSIREMESDDSYSAEYYEEFNDYYTVDWNVMMNLLTQENKPAPKISKKTNRNFDISSWEQVDALKQSLVERIEQEQKTLKFLQRKAETDVMKKDIKNLNGHLKSALLDVHTILRKPTVAFVGTSDVGKSTMINQLLGTEKLPVAWTPTTSMSIVIKHMDDQPTFIDDELTFFGGPKKLFDIKKLHDQKYAEKYKVDGGDASLLEQFGTRQSGKANDATHAVLYLNSDLLKVCDFVDLPGFGTGDSQLEDQLAQQSYNFADIVVFLSRANGFMHGKDIEFLKAALMPLKPLENKQNQLPALSNLFIVASQAHTVEKGNITALNEILDISAQRLYKEIPQQLWDNRQKQTGIPVTEADLRNRFFYYATDNGQLREPLEKGLNTLLAAIPNITLDGSQDMLEQTFAHYQGIIKHEYINVLNTQKSHNEMLASYIKKKNSYNLNKVELSKGASELQRLARQYELECFAQFELELKEIVSEQNVIRVIDENGYKNKKADLERLSSYLTTQIQLKLQSILSQKAESYQNHIEQFIEKYDCAINTELELEFGSFSIPFNTKAVFAGALAGLGTFGALSIWASSLGNLGAYILVAKGVSILSAVGISVGGTAAATAGVAAIGGPVVLGIALAGILGVSMWKLFSGSWKKDVAKAVQKQFLSASVTEQLTGEITTFWDMSIQELQHGIKQIECEQQNELQQLEEMLKEENQPLLESKAQLLKAGFTFYDQLLTEAVGS